MDRRHFLSTTAAGVAFAQEKIRRVGLIGCGWYGKADLFRLVQVAPVEIVSLCDVDHALKLGRTLAFDPARAAIYGDAEANRMLRRPYRQPWVHPTPEA